MIDIEKLQDRAAEIGRWLSETAPFVTADQKHLDENTSERAYWHYGYRAALLDVIRMDLSPLVLKPHAFARFLAALKPNNVINFRLRKLLRSRSPWGSVNND